MNNTGNINVNRRNFLRYTSLTGAALILGISKSNASGAAVISNLSNAEEGYNLSPFIIIEKSGKITIFNTKPEMGQGTFQSIPALIAEELELAPGQFTVVQTGGEKKFGDGQAAGGSYSVRSSYEMMRKVGASAREMLISAASRQWNVPVSECYAEFARGFPQTFRTKPGIRRTGGNGLCAGSTGEPAAQGSEDIQDARKIIPTPGCATESVRTSRFRY